MRIWTKKQGIIALVILVAIIVLSRGILNINESVNDDNEVVEGIPVVVTSVRKDDLKSEIRYTGTIRSQKTSTLAPQISSDVKNIFIEEGDFVEKGQQIALLNQTKFIAKKNTLILKKESLLIQIKYIKKNLENFDNTEPLLQTLEKMKTDHKYLTLDKERYDKLYDNGIVSVSDYESMTQSWEKSSLSVRELELQINSKYDNLVEAQEVYGSQVAEINGSLNELELELEETIIRAPEEGIVQEFFYDEGDLAIGGQPFALINSGENKIIEIMVSESDLTKLSTDMKVIIYKHDQTNIIAEKIKIPVAINENTRTGKVEIMIPVEYSKTGMLIGSSIKVGFITANHKNVIIIPNQSIKRLKEKSYVYVVRENIAIETEVETGLISNSDVQILKGLSENEQIVVENVLSLYDNARVMIFKGDN